MMADIRRNQGRLQEAHERSKTVTRSEEMKKLREQMQARAAWGLPCGAGRAAAGSWAAAAAQRMVRCAPSVA